MYVVGNSYYLDWDGMIVEHIDFADDFFLLWALSILLDWTSIRCHNSMSVTMMIHIFVKCKIVLTEEQWFFINCLIGFRRTKNVQSLHFETLAVWKVNSSLYTDFMLSCFERKYLHVVCRVRIGSYESAETVLWPVCHKTWFLCLRVHIHFSDSPSRLVYGNIAMDSFSPTGSPCQECAAAIMNAH